MQGTVAGGFGTGGVAAVPACWGLLLGVCQNSGKAAPSWHLAVLRAAPAGTDQAKKQPQK